MKTETTLLTTETTSPTELAQQQFKEHQKFVHFFIQKKLGVTYNEEIANHIAQFPAGLSLVFEEETDSFAIDAIYEDTLRNFKTKLKELMDNFTSDKSKQDEILFCAASDYIALSVPDMMLYASAQEIIRKICFEY